MGANHVRCRTEAMPQWVCMTLIQCLRTIEHDQEEIQNVLSRCYWYIGIYMVCCHQLMFKVAQAVLSLSASYRSGVAYKYFWRLLCVKARQGSGDKGVESPGIDAALLSGSDTPPAILVCMETVIS
ncbi:uncharacterized protein LOC124665584 isoform X2 [Lolium rigidum]|uniref:uncharacterized protein LOC124665584 isoform X2 n=1 Tax=Lolium rigidum TaxID=89674 RepID=UPI001F5E230B|nr:uncharacterized protein LOC124665584 isoform X2 [Lolium rigidum]